MTKYKNLGGDSNVIGYEIGSDYIKVKFGDEACYLYNYSKPGSTHVNEMKRLAVAGQGLNSYIGRVVKKNFASKSK